MNTLSLDVRDQFSTLGQIGFENPIKKSCKWIDWFLFRNPSYVCKYFSHLMKL